MRQTKAYRTKSVKIFRESRVSVIVAVRNKY